MDKTKSKRTLSAEEINAELAKLFESDVKEFSENGAKAFGHILAKHGIDDPQKWLEEKMRETDDPETQPYFIKKGAPSCNKFGAISFPTLEAANKFVRAHEMAHRITRALMDKVIENEKHSVMRLGFYIIDVKMKLNKITGKVKEIYCIDTDSGRAFNEGVAHLLAEKLSGITHNGWDYKTEKIIAKQVSEITNEDTVFEAAFFNPNILANKWQDLTGDRHSFAKIVYSLDKYQHFWFKYLGAKNKLKEKALHFLLDRAYKQSNKEVKKYLHLVNKNSCDNDIVQVSVEERKSAKQTLQNIRANSKLKVKNVEIIRKSR